MRKFILFAVVFISISIYADTKVFANTYSALSSEATVNYNNEEIGTIAAGSVIEIIDIGSLWTEITYGDVKASIKTSSIMNKKTFIKFLENNPQLTTKVVTCNTNNVRVRKDRKLDGKPVGVIGTQSSISVTLSVDGWSLVTSNTIEGWVPSDNLSIVYKIKVPTYVNSESVRQKIVDFALKFVGNPYVWGGTSLTTGADCSGFCQSVYKQFGINIPRVSSEQSKGGKPVDLHKVRPGDLVFYERGGENFLGHVGIYIGNGKLVQARGSLFGIVVTDMYFRQPLSARSYIN